MEAKEVTLEGMDETTKLQFLELLLNDLHQEGLVTTRTLVQIATDVMAIDYQDDEDLLCFNCLDEHEEE